MNKERINNLFDELDKAHAKQLAVDKAYAYLMIERVARDLTTPGWEGDEDRLTVHEAIDRCEAAKAKVEDIKARIKKELA